MQPIPYVFFISQYHLGCIRRGYPYLRVEITIKQFKICTVKQIQTNTVYLDIHTLTKNYHKTVIKSNQTKQTQSRARLLNQNQKTSSHISTIVCFYFPNTNMASRTCTGFLSYKGNLEPNGFCFTPEITSVYFGSAKKELMDGMISGSLLRTNFLNECSAYFSPSAKLSSTPAALFSLFTLYVSNKISTKATTHLTARKISNDPEGPRGLEQITNGE